MRNAVHIVGGRSRFSLGGTCKREARFFICDKMRHFDRIAYGVDVGNVRAVIVIDEDTARRAERDACRLCKFGFRPHAERHDDRPCSDLFAAFGRNVFFADLFDAVAEDESDAFVVQLFVQNLRHIVIERREHLVEFFDERDVFSGKLKVFCDFDTDKSAADYDDIAYRVLRNVIVDLFDIDDVAHRKYVRFIDARNRTRHDGRRARRKDERIVAFVKLFSARQILYGNRFFIGVYFEHFVRRFRDNIILFFKLLGRHKHEVAAFFYDPAQKKGQRTIRKRNVRPLFKHNDFSTFIESSGTGGNGSTACDSADDYDFFCHFFNYLLFL